MNRSVARRLDGSPVDAAGNAPGEALAPAPASEEARLGRSAATGALSIADVLRLQRMAGNRAVAQLLARKPADKEPPLDPRAADLSFALDYVRDYYDGVHDLIELRDKIRTQAIKNFENFGALKDPPSIADAIFAEIFSQAIGLIPGGKLVKATLTAGVFAGQLAQLERDLTARPIPGISVETEAKKGPSEKTKAKVEKVYGHGKSGVDAGKAVVEAGIKAYKERAAASAAEAAANENAAMNQGRISDWRKATELARKQKKAITDSLRSAVHQGTDLGQLNDVVVKRLGPIPTMTAKLQDELERRYELELYRQKLTIVMVTTKYHGGYRMPDSSSEELALVGGGAISASTRLRIAELLGEPGWLAGFPVNLGERLGVARSSRTKHDRVPGFEPSRPGAGG